LQVIDVDHPWVSVNLPEDIYHGMAPGRVLVGEVPALGRNVRFRVARIAPQGEFATQRATRATRGYDVHAIEVAAPGRGRGGPASGDERAVRLAAMSIAAGFRAEVDRLGHNRLDPRC
jgi:hypothetical protein